MTYKEYNKKTQDEFNKLPLFWAFSDDQFEKALAERGIKVEEAKEHVYHSKALIGAFYLKKDAPIIQEYFKRDRMKELRDIMNKDAGFALEAFEYEMMNHEYPINWEGDYDVASCFGHCEFAEDKGGIEYLTELGFNQQTIDQWFIARKKVIKACDW